MYQRSADMFLGNPFNIASTALLTHMIAHVTNLDVGKIVICIGDAHIYTNHIDGVKEMLTREPLPLPTLKVFKNCKERYCVDHLIDDYGKIGYRQKMYSEDIKFILVSEFYLILKFFQLRFDLYLNLEQHF